MKVSKKGDDWGLQISESDKELFNCKVCKKEIILSETYHFCKDGDRFWCYGCRVADWNTICLYTDEHIHYSVRFVEVI